MASRRIKIGILGTGAQAVTFVKLAPSLEADIQLVAVASHKGGIDHAKAFSDKYEIPRNFCFISFFFFFFFFFEPMSLTSQFLGSYGGYETLIQDNDIDAVYDR
jgi:predicted dehydrogenase